MPGIFEPEQGHYVALDKVDFCGPDDEQGEEQKRRAIRFAKSE